ncbi:MAG: hypothetical protein KKB37_17075 [Alphaproteobacteria bacterium]|nr:hypothetical protein [Alphaproteobacteria bacterium]
MSQELREFLELSVTYINKHLSAKKRIQLKRKFTPRENRTVLLNIGSPAGTIGFKLDEKMNVTLDTIINPTVEVKLSEDTFWHLVTKKKTPPEAFFDGSINFIGQNILRDYLVLSALFNELSSLYEELTG